jgi:hypothetical protein
VVEGARVVEQRREHRGQRVRLDVGLEVEALVVIVCLRDRELAALTVARAQLEAGLAVVGRRHAGVGSRRYRALCITRRASVAGLRGATRRTGRGASAQPVHQRALGGWRQLGLLGRRHRAWPHARQPIQGARVCELLGPGGLCSEIGQRGQGHRRAELRQRGVTRAAVLIDDRLDVAGQRAAAAGHHVPAAGYHAAAAVGTRCCHDRAVGGYCLARGTRVALFTGGPEAEQRQRTESRSPHESRSF